MKSRKQEILEAAAALFRSHGYPGTSLKVIAQHVGMEAAPSLYNHITSKQAILSELMLGIAHDFSRGMEDVVQTQSNPREKLEGLIHLHLRLTIEQPNAIALIIHEWIHLESEAKRQFLGLREEYEQQFRQILQQGVEEGYFKALDVDLMLFTLLSTLRSLYAWYGRYQHYTQKPFLPN